MSDSESLHEVRCLLMEDGWDSVGKPEDRLLVVIQRWQETRDGNRLLTAENAALRSERDALKALVSEARLRMNGWTIFSSFTQKVPRGPDDGWEKWNEAADAALSEAKALGVKGKE